ncbi:hypothetical protein BDV96DRAFT_651064 [Lophiotrema nucula]|uniref:EthD domain-containing protein n=1 Tax=Lophiotrema nucula TaxID=690887 RepID=A0A6A5YUI2_9PLEO|nr:hypothetical protein BDV96DRAFT_651064 [Lophiotrema nucula]
MIASRLIGSLLAVVSSFVVVANGMPSPDTAASIHEPRQYSQPSHTTQQSSTPTHAYRFRELSPGYPSKSNQQTYFRGALCFKHSPNITEEAYHGYWKHVHADNCMGTKDFTVHIYRYNQFHVDSHSKKALQPLIDQGMNTFMLSIPDSLLKDEQKFVDEDFGLFIFGGYENVIYGSDIKTSHGANGIMPGDPRLTF